MRDGDWAPNHALAADPAQTTAAPAVNRTAWLGRRLSHGGGRPEAHSFASRRAARAVPVLEDALERLGVAVLEDALQRLGVAILLLVFTLVTPRRRDEAPNHALAANPAQTTAALAIDRAAWLGWRLFHRVGRLEVNMFASRRGARTVAALKDAL